MSKKRHQQAQRARLRRHQDEQRRAKKAALHEAALQPSAVPPETSPGPELQGGSGGSYVLPGPGLKDSRLEQRAIKQRWPVKDEYREPLMNRQVTIAIDPHSSPKESTSAFRAVLAADLANMEQERRDSKIPEYHQHEHSGTVTVQERKVFWIHLGQILRDAPEQKERVAALLRQHIEAERDNPTSEESYEQPAR
jgi:hypothetical protein